MLPSFLYSTYKRYKEDTAYVAQWIAETAKACGSQSPMFEDPAPPKVKKAKGKNYKKAVRDATRRAAASRRNQIIPTKDFIPLAQHIADYDNPPVKVPGTFIKAVNRAIGARYRSQAYYNTLESLHSDANSTHLHFIHVLEGVLAALKPRFPAETTISDLNSTKPPTESVDDSSAESLPTALAGLNVEEPSQDDLFATSTPEAEPTAPETLFRPEPMKEKEAFDFAAYCLFADVNKILDYVKHLWRAYANGEIDLVAASITANTAIDVVRRLEEEFLKDFPKTKNAEEIITWAYGARCIRNGKNPDITSGQSETGENFNFNLDCYDEAEYHLLISYLLLEGFSKVVQPNETPLSKPGHFGIYDPSSDRDAKSALGKFEEDRIVLCEALPDFCFLAKIRQNVPAEDEFTRGLRDMVHTKKIPLWLVFAAQCYLEGHHILRSGVDKAFIHLQRRGLQIKKSVQANFDFHQTLRIDNWPEANDKTMAAATIHLVNDWLIKDPIHANMTKVMRNAPGPNAIPPPFNLLKQHPLLCGLFEFALDLHAQDAALVFVNAWGSIMDAAHLYNAVVQESACKSAWPEMTELITIHIPQKVFVGGLPVNPEQYLKHFLLCMGQSVASLSKNSRNPGLVKSKNGPRVLHPDSPVSQLFRRRYTENAGQLDINLEHVEALLNERFESTTNPEDFVEKDGMKMGVLSIEQRETRKKLSRKVMQTQKLSMLELLVALQGSISIELPELEFDYLQLHRTCWRMLREVQQRLHPSLLKYLDPGYLGRENQLPFVVGYIFGIGYRSDKAAKQLFKLRDDAPTTSRLLQQAGAVVEEFLVRLHTERANDPVSSTESDEDVNGGVPVPRPNSGSEPRFPGLPGINNLYDLLAAARASGLGSFELTDEGRAAEAAGLM